MSPAPFWITLALVALTSIGCPSTTPADDDDTGDDDAGDDDDEEPSFPVEPIALVTGQFQRCEGIAFNGEGQLYATCDHSLWRISPDGEAAWVADMDSNLGVAAVGDRDLLVADFGPINAFDHGPNDDGVVWRFTPEGVASQHLPGIGDPNFIAVRDDGSYLVSDDAVDEIWLVQPDGDASLFSQSIDHPNGLVFSEDRETLYVAQIFESLVPFTWDDRIWALPLDGDQPAGDPELLVAAGEGHDGLAMDHLGRVYSASNNSGQILRVDPADGTVVVVAEGMEGVASLAFGLGDFDPLTVFATNHRTGDISAVYVGVEGLPLAR